MDIDNPSRIYRCQKCRDTGRVKEENGSIHTCWDCLQNGNLEQHSKKLPDSRIRI